jgi:hypothetical protein
MTTQTGGNRNTIIIVVVVIALLLCCCISAVAAWFLWTYGDQIFNGAAPSTRALLQMLA